MSFLILYNLPIIPLKKWMTKYLLIEWFLYSCEAVHIKLSEE